MMLVQQMGSLGVPLQSTFLKMLLSMFRMLSSPAILSVFNFTHNRFSCSGEGSLASILVLLQMIVPF